MGNVKKDSQKRKNANHEARLVQCFSKVIKSDEKFGIKKKINIGRDNKLCADIEYLSYNGEYLIIEAKSHESKDAYNTRHKIFGQLLKEHSKESLSRNEYYDAIVLGILIPKDKPISGKSNIKKTGYDFYRKGFLNIPECKFCKFGKLVKAKYVFVCSLNAKVVDIYSWIGFYRGNEPIRTCSIV